ncbi:hypothetical protein Q3G72_015125 [Acer saccharum]|nr:hypothetical protein Q3G72_015125 [Acer saccharum]
MALECYMGHSTVFSYLKKSQSSSVVIDPSSVNGKPSVFDSLGNSSSRNVTDSVPPKVGTTLSIPTPMVAKGDKSYTDLLKSTVVNEESLIASVVLTKKGEAQHEHTQFVEVKRARDAVFDFGIHDSTFFAKRFDFGWANSGATGSLQDSPGLAPALGGATHKLLTVKVFRDKDQTGRFRDVIEAYRRPPFFSQSIPNGPERLAGRGVR